MQRSSTDRPRGAAHVWKTPNPSSAVRRWSQNLIIVTTLEEDEESILFFQPTQSPRTLLLLLFMIIIIIIIFLFIIIIRWSDTTPLIVFRCDYTSSSVECNNMANK